MRNNKQIEKHLELPHQETIVGINTIQTKPFDNQKITKMSNNKQSSVEWYIIERHIIEIQSRLGLISPIEYDAKLIKIEEQAKAMQQEQAQLYATFVLKCVQNNLPPITFNDWINLENNEQQ